MKGECVGCASGLSDALEVRFTSPIRFDAFETTTLASNRSYQDFVVLVRVLCAFAVVFATPLKPLEKR
jgi:hypothetical protein